MSTLARDEDILQAAEDWRKAGRGVALATVVETWGSAPRPVGSNSDHRRRATSWARSRAAASKARWSTEAIDVIENGKPQDAGVRRRRRDRLEGRPLLRRHHPGLSGEGRVTRPNAADSRL